ncbi:endonuclease [Shigella phage vB_SdyM_006]|nr:endonuclease [Shigella phage vB_SdyM_006]
MFYYTYKIKNKINNKIYIGVHKTKDLEDGYFGSGKILKKAIEKYGKENFEKTILKFHKNKYDMFIHEAKIVTEKFVKSKNTYNLKVGGEGGWDYINSLPKSKLTISKQVNTFKKRLRLGLYDFSKKKNSFGFKNKRHSDISKNKISINNASTLSKDEINYRLEILKSFDISIRGNLNKFAKHIGLSHTQARRFINKYAILV